MNGTIKKFCYQRMYGFITSEDGKTYFLIPKNITSGGFDSLDPGTPVSFDVDMKRFSSMNGFHPLALNIKIMQPKQEREVKNG